MDSRSFREKLSLIDDQQRMPLVVERRVQKIKNTSKCPGCWLQPTLCTCSLWKRVCCEIKVLVHIHYAEWGLSGNTGICIHRTLEDSMLLLKDRPVDEEKLEAIWNDDAFTKVVLWPSEESISVEELKSKMSPESELLLIVPDASFSAARRMVKKYPKGHLKGRFHETHQMPKCTMLLVSLSSESVLGDKPNSFLHPVRKYGGSEIDTGRVSTLEAVAAFMREFGEASIVADNLISNMKLQMDRALKQKSRPILYGTETI